ncbi:hypothetical protein POTOM_028093 [Populus tomentosa]|uniref:AB hydrolase-1 domain-containing protein n=1 Tax=Populus tomentosa TaxID=118781 RepID=A0A8X7ZD74_POPTO|nr:hypothetical protein POTOM_028093 [Populus tomentosa]
MGDSNNQTTHFVLIHGSASGAWAWYKVKTMLEAAGHSVTALDMSASGFIENSPAVADGWQSVVSSTAGYEAFMKSTAFNLASPEDLSLQTLQKRSGSLFLESLAKANKFTKEKFGSVVRDYVVCTQDLLVVPSLQRFMIEHNEVKEVMEIPADHMAIASRPKELCQCLLEFARKHA